MVLWVNAVPDGGEPLVAVSRFVRIEIGENVVVLAPVETAGFELASGQVDADFVIQNPRILYPDTGVMDHIVLEVGRQIGCDIPTFKQAGRHGRELQFGEVRFHLRRSSVLNREHGVMDRPIDGVGIQSGGAKAFCSKCGHLLHEICR